MTTQRIRRIVAGLALVSLPINLAHADIERVKAWVLADQPTAGYYQPAPEYQFNSQGAINEITREGIGHYQATFPKLGTQGGTVHVSSYGGNHYCKVSSWGPTDRTQHVVIRCFSPSGRPMDGKFTILFYKETRRGTWADGYVWANQPTTSSYYPHKAYRWNSKGGINSIRRSGAGRYRVRFPRLNTGGGTVLVTSYGNGSEQCKAARWHQTGNATDIEVQCSTAAGHPTDTQFTLSFLTDLALGVRASEDRHDGGYVWANQPHAASYTPPASYQLNNAGSQNHISRIAKGSYKANFPRLIHSNRTTVQVTSSGTGQEYCTVNRWSSDSQGGTDTYITCFSPTGRLADSPFTLVYLTSDHVPF